jgi:hypothetical protein
MSRRSRRKICSPWRQPWGRVQMRNEPRRGETSSRVCHAVALLFLIVLYPRLAPWATDLLPLSAAVHPWGGATHQGGCHSDQGGNRSFLGRNHSFFGEKHSFLGKSHKRHELRVESLSRSLLLAVLYQGGYYPAWPSSSARRSGRMWGNMITSRIDCLLASSITNRSMPMPIPAAGGMP